MTDVVDPKTRSRMMAGIKGKNTRPEILVRSALHRRGFRFKLHDKTLPGKPDIVLPKYKAVINIHGCFWHGHDCKFFKVPSTRTEFWLAKINGNRSRDSLHRDALLKQGWRVLTVWECALRELKLDGYEKVMEEIIKWLTVEPIPSTEITP
ncbi:very short patch repair endonuclease [Limnobacter sp. MED105]|uniref:very short patch repair endonuclease n=1 Tax=Limnobacter sp. MED105 TaxID=391597 RepID=UPI000156CA77|nr:DNA mismatch endonuclease Vsr [Limnobacter sp. MED105]EDM83433.1 Putative DNA mismatch endonuclease [Limnobacter sp. MED105]